MKYRKQQKETWRRANKRSGVINNVTYDGRRRRKNKRNSAIKEGIRRKNGG